MGQIKTFLNDFFDKVFNNKRYKIMFALIVILVCIIALCIGIYVEFFYEYSKADPLMIGIKVGAEKSNEYYNNLKLEFNNIFTNTLETENPNNKFDKIQDNKDVIYTAYSLNNEDENYYQINSQIPSINIDSQNAKSINDKIKEEFYNQANAIMRKTGDFTIYNVSYAAFINEDIVSIVVKSSLKEKNKNEKVVVKTYNYCIPDESILSLEGLIELKQMTKKQIQSKINEEIKKSYKNALAIAEQYGSTYERNPENEMYKIENTKEFFLTYE